MVTTNYLYQNGWVKVNSDAVFLENTCEYGVIIRDHAYSIILSAHKQISTQQFILLWELQATSYIA